MKQVAVGLTGTIGAGKSTVAELLRGFGADVASGDVFGREVITEDRSVIAQITAKLGATIVRPDGSLDRAAIAARVFDDPELSAWLTALTFPGIHERWRKFLNHSTAEVVVFDAALIHEWKIAHEFDLILCIISEHGVAQKRSANRFSEADFERRWQAQLSADVKAAESDIVVPNNDSLAELTTHITRIWQTNILPLTR
ncbi:MAG: dephospho-CoA kinase [bacterium]|nr:dephospho-CoA kinase [bacterium]